MSNLPIFEPGAKLLLFYRFVFYGTLVLGCVLAFAPANQTLHANVNDKVLHGIGFFVLAFWSHLAHPRARGFIPVIGLSVFGILIELVQAALPYRSFSWLDWLADVFGVFAYYLLLAPLLVRFAARPGISEPN